MTVATLSKSRECGKVNRRSKAALLPLLKGIGRFVRVRDEESLRAHCRGGLPEGYQPLYPEAEREEEIMFMSEFEYDLPEEHDFDDLPEIDLGDDVEAHVDPAILRALSAVEEF